MRIAPDRTILTLAAVFGLAAIALLWHQGRTQARLVESTAVQDAARYSAALREFRTLYTSEVVESVTAHGVVASPDGRYAFVSNESVGSVRGTLDVIDLESLEVVATVELEHQSGGIDFWRVEG